MKIGQVEEVYIHENATDFVTYTFEDGTYLSATNYHPIYTKQGWKSYTQKNGYETPQIGDEVKTQQGWKKITEIRSWTGVEDCYDYKIKSSEGKNVGNYYANDVLVESWF